MSEVPLYMCHIRSTGIYVRGVSGAGALLATRFHPKSTASHEFSPLVNSLILGTKLPHRVVPDHLIDLRFWLQES